MKNIYHTKTKKTRHKESNNTALHAIHSLTQQNFTHSSKMFNAYLKTGIQLFGMENGLLSKVNGQNYKILAVQSPHIHFQTNNILVLDQTYCAEIIRGSKTVWFTRKSNTFKSEKQNYFEQLGLITYIGTPIYVREKLYGTLCFASTGSKTSDFTDKDIYSIEIMANFLGQHLTLKTHKHHNLISNHVNLRLNDIIKRSNLAIMEVDPKGRFIKINKACEIELGFKLDDIFNKTLFDFMHPEDRLRLQNQFEKLMQGETPANFQGHCLGSEGNYGWIEWVLSRQPDNKTILAIARIINDRVNNEQILERYHRDLEKTILNRTKALENSKEQFRSLAQHLMKIREEERTNVARDIHDELGNALTALHFDLEWIHKRIFGQKTIKKKIRESMKIVNNTITTTQRLTKELRPRILDDLGLFAAIEWYTEEFRKRNNVQFELTIQGPDLPTKDLATNIFRLYQESLTNIARHAQATKVSTTLRIGRKYISLTIQDNGIGIKKNNIENKKSFGLIGMNERVTFLSGTISIVGSEKEGTLISISIPISENMELNKQIY